MFVQQEVVRIEDWQNEKIEKCCNKNLKACKESPNIFLIDEMNICSN